MTWLILVIFILVFGYSAWRNNGGFDIKESILLLFGCLTIVFFKDMSDDKFNTLAWALVLGAGILKAGDIAKIYFGKNK